MEYRTIAKQGLHLAQVSESVKMFKFALSVILFFAQWQAVSVMVFIRRNFGERALSWMNLYFGYSAVWIFTFLAGVLPFGGHFGSVGFMSLPMLVCYLMFIAAGIFHRWWISKRNEYGIQWHSFYGGESLLYDWAAADKDFRDTFGRFLNDEFIQKWIEPVVVFVLGLIAYPISGPVGLWLTLSGLSLGVHSQIIFYFQREQVLDLVDSQIEAQFYNDAVAGKPASKTAGFTIAESNIKTINSDPGLQAAFANLGNEMKALVTPPSRIINPYDEPMVTLR